MPIRILSVSCRDPSYKGTDDVPPDASTTVVTEPPAPSSRAVALRSAVSATTPSPPTLPHSGTPGVARVTSISSSANASASVSSKSKAVRRRSRRFRDEVFELREVLWSLLGQRPGEEEMDAMFLEYDVKNNNGAVKFFGELRRLMTARLVYKNTREEFTEAFREIDRNGDGNLEIGDLKRLLVVTGYGFTDRELEEIFGVFDKDGSGRVDQEFVDYIMAA